MNYIQIKALKEREKGKTKWNHKSCESNFKYSFHVLIFFLKNQDILIHYSIVYPSGFVMFIWMVKMSVSTSVSLNFKIEWFQTIKHNSFLTAKILGSEVWDRILEYDQKGWLSLTVFSWPWFINFNLIAPYYLYWYLCD